MKSQPSCWPFASTRSSCPYVVFCSHAGYMTWRPWLVEVRSEHERVRGVKSLGQSRSAWCIFRQKAVWVTSESGDGRAEQRRYDVPQGDGVKNPSAFCCAARWRGMATLCRFLSRALFYGLACFVVFSSPARWHFTRFTFMNCDWLVYSVSQQSATTKCVSL